MIALIPARSGSKRIPGKNTKLLAGHPLIAYTISAAIDSGIFSDVIVSSDDTETLQIAHHYGATGRSRPAELATDDSPDIEWVKYVLRHKAEDFAILRPTSPFRTAQTIRRALVAFVEAGDQIHSLRAVSPVREHPGKMWQIDPADGLLAPMIGPGWPLPHQHPLYTRIDAPWHSQPTQNLPTVYVQNASLEMAKSWVIPAFGTISGTKILPFFTEGYESTDLNSGDDWDRAEWLLLSGRTHLPPVGVAALSDPAAAQ